MSSYLNNRERCVKIGVECLRCLDRCSSYILIIYVRFQIHKKINLFADNTNLLCCGDNLEQLLDAVADGLMKLKSCFDSNKLTLNLNKIHSIWKSVKKKNLQKTLLINYIEIERVNETTPLAVIIDSKVSWKSHIIH